MRINTRELNELKNKIVVIDNTYVDFVGTDLENDNFSISVKGISRVDNINLSVAFQNEDGSIKAGDYSFEKFKTSIVEVSGFINEDDEELSFNETINFLWENAPRALEDAITKAMDSFRVIEEEKKSEIETSIENMQDGSHNIETTV